MQKDRSSKAIALVALLVAVVGLSLGFAAFSQNLTINSLAKYRVSNEDYSVVFSSDPSTVVTNTILPLHSKSDDEVQTKLDTTITETEINNLGAIFRRPGQWATYEFYVLNAGEIDAQLSSIDYVTTDGKFSKCTPHTEGNAPSSTIDLDSICDDFVIEVTVGDIKTTGTKNGITGKVLKAGESTKVTVKISYEEKEDQVRSDGDFNVTFGSIKLNYKSGSSSNPSN